MRFLFTREFQHGRRIMMPPRSGRAGAYVMPTFKKTCTWTVAASDSAIRMVTLNLQDLNRFKAGKQSPAATPGAGIGDDSYYLGVGPTQGLVVKKGVSAFKVAVYCMLPTQQKRAMEQALARQALANL